VFVPPAATNTKTPTSTTKLTNGFRPQKSIITIAHTDALCILMKLVINGITEHVRFAVTPAYTTIKIISAPTVNMNALIISLTANAPIADTVKRCSARYAARLHWYRDLLVLVDFFAAFCSRGVVRG
jgi:hypothetical protein